MYYGTSGIKEWYDDMFGVIQSLSKELPIKVKRKRNTRNKQARISRRKNR